MRFILLFLIVSFALVFTTCKKDPVSPEEEFFDIEYWFINQGDPDIMAVEISSFTYYPESKNGWLGFKNFQRPAPKDTLIDTVSTDQEKGYVGVITEMAVQVIKQWENTNEPCWRYYHIPRLDTVKTIEDRIRKFHWPSDTTIAEELYQDRIGFCQPE